MKLKPVLVLCVLLCAAAMARADNTSSFGADLLIQPIFGQFLQQPVDLKFIAHTFSSLEQTAYISGVILEPGTAIPTSLTDLTGVCISLESFPYSLCNSTGELPVSRSSENNGQDFYLIAMPISSVHAGINTWTLFTYGGFNGSNDFSLVSRDTESFDISSVPEPSTFLMLGTGLLGIAGVVRRKMLA